MRNERYRKNAIGVRERHNERKNEAYSNPDVLLEYSSQNVVFKTCGAPTYAQQFDRMVAEGTVSTRGLKPDAYVFDKMVFDVNTEYFERHGGYEYAKKFYAEAYELAKQIAGGEQYVISAVMHADERNREASDRLGKDVFHYHICFQNSGNEFAVVKPVEQYNALYGHSEKGIIIIDVLIQKDIFFKTFLPLLFANSKLLRFFLDPQTNQFSDEFIHLQFCEDTPIRQLLEMMVVEYANNWETKQNIIKSLVLTLFMYVSRHYTDTNKKPASDRLSDRIMQYMAVHSDTVTLKDITKNFSYHPNYISGLLHKELGKSFSEILLEQRMEKSTYLLKGTNLPIEDISAISATATPVTFTRRFGNITVNPPESIYKLYRQKLDYAIQTAINTLRIL